MYCEKSAHGLGNRWFNVPTRERPPFLKAPLSRKLVHVMKIFARPTKDQHLLLGAKGIPSLRQLQQE